MNTVKFLGVSTDMPREKEVKTMILPVPQPGINEYRRLYNHREVEQEETAEDNEQRAIVAVPCADFVAVQADHEPTVEEWRTVLSENGFTDEQIDVILAGE